MTEPRPPASAVGAPRRVDALIDELEQLADQLRHTVDRLREHVALPTQESETDLMSDNDPATDKSSLETAVGKLDERVGGLQTSVLGLGRQVRRRTVVIGACMLLIVIVLASTVPAMVVVSLSNRDAIIANNQRFCPFLAILIPSPGEPKPTTPRGVKVAQDAARLYASRDFNCGDPNALPPAPSSTSIATAPPSRTDRP